jgi:multisubunit Na+/H+ antiporter MnhC subunit
MPSIGRVLIGIGLVITAVGLLFLFLGRLNVPVGRLPGDITYTGRNITIYFPIVTCLVISIVISIVFWLLNRR